jgi:hypothetical protein
VVPLDPPELPLVVLAAVPLELLAVPLLVVELDPTLPVLLVELELPTAPLLLVPVDAPVGHVGALGEPQRGATCLKLVSHEAQLAARAAAVLAGAHKFGALG